MKKQVKVSRLHKMSCDAIAKNLKKGLGRNKALSVADNMVRGLSSIGPTDFSTEFFSIETLKRGRNIWTQVRNILAKQKA